MIFRVLGRESSMNIDSIPVDCSRQLGLVIVTGSAAIRFAYA